MAEADSSFLKFYLVTDTHYFSPELKASGEAYDSYMRREQMCLAENCAIVRSTFAQIAADSSTDIVIIPGDLTKNGEKASHISFIKELERLRDAGKRVYVITARHDFNSSPVEYSGTERITVEGTEREELFDLYYEFGYSDAVAVDRESLSYVAQLAPKVRMLALNSDGSGEDNKGCFDSRLMKWIKEQTDSAHADGCFLFAINHYPILPSSPIFTFVKDAKMQHWQELAAFFADNGVNLVFTGHMHIQSIKKFVPKSGNPFYDVCTSALVGSPAMYRKVTMPDENTAEIISLTVSEFYWDMQGLTVKEYFDRQFASMISNRINDMLSSGAIKKTVKKIVGQITLGTIGRLMWFRVDRSIAKTKAIDFAVTIVHNIFAGDAPFVQGTAEYCAVSKALKRLRPVIKIVQRKLPTEFSQVDLNKIVLDSIGNNTAIADNNAVISLRNL